ncbi:phosphatidylethanolamine N-methyltransferase family protein [Haloterrigena salifodinae]|uniref:Phosphatidylethanolamine N-methyltransferase family protein n=1 Tax=Haloterrigena salifodinae TaxID=2675099 RepID=A0A8T8E7K9_9EURY|nr:PEMT/PEM2 methyltransferase family protein [Haloterrigena salifodinae]QRV17331.1 phosphatidylethanolamine N-methyltransferase family protein [Haloterrigena salifodinae]
MINALTSAVFVVGVGLALANLTGIVASALGLVSYWPPGERDRTYYVHWGISHSLNVVMLALTYLSWNSLGLPRGPSLAAGAALFVAGYGVAITAGLDLGVEETKGLAGDLRTGGWYRYSRNPQYVGYVVATVGFALLANSGLVAVVCAIYLGWWLSLPFAEEPWLREQYGEEYERYAERVPRFVGRRTVRALVGNRADETAVSDRG